jgi:hypothetical protein
MVIDRRVTADRNRETLGGFLGEELPRYHAVTARRISSTTSTDQENDVTGTPRANRVESIPSIISIECPSIILITLTNESRHSGFLWNPEKHHRILTDQDDVYEDQIEPSARREVWSAVRPLREKRNSLAPCQIGNESRSTGGQRRDGIRWKNAKKSDSG